MADHVPDDIFALCSRFDLDLDNYRIFPKVVSAPAEESTAPVAGISVPPLAPLQDCAEKETETVHNVVVPPALGRFTLRNLWVQVGLSPERRPSRPLTHLLASRTVIRGVAGGCGATTVSATLARIFSKNQQRCGVVTHKDNAVLPCYFGDSSLLHGNQHAISIASGQDATVRILTVSEIEAALAAGSALYELDLFLVDHPEGVQLFESDSAVPSPASIVLVAVPDVSSVIHAQRLRALYSQEFLATRLVCVLNKFDRKQPLHLEICEWFTRNFPQMATISRTDLVNESLADGMSVIDWAPDSEVAHEFTGLSQLLHETTKPAVTTEAQLTC
jgi:MinD-like ATPase involved in chromosome partitioning or flagellar assembly